jgi:alkylhydroperoxidase family enzyme
MSRARHSASMAAATYTEENLELAAIERWTADFEVRREAARGYAQQRLSAGKDLNLPISDSRHDNKGSSGPHDAIKASSRDEVFLDAQRIAPLRPDEFGPEAIDILTEMRTVMGVPPTDSVPDSVATMLRHPNLYSSYASLARQLMSGSLAARDRELLILRNAWICQAPFEWGEHVAVGKRVAGLTSEEIDRVTAGSVAPGWSNRERSLLRAVEELHESAIISDETWRILAEFFNEKELIEILIVVGQYTCVAFVQNSLRVTLRPENAGLSAR